MNSGWHTPNGMASKPCWKKSRVGLGFDLFSGHRWACEPMHLLVMLLILTGFYPWMKGWRNVKKSSLSHALAWTCLAWLSWAAVMGPLPLSMVHSPLSIRYLALCLTACAGVAVLGARRPHVGAWNFVVAGLLMVLALPLLENLVLGSRPIGPVRIGFLAVTLLVVLGNYLATSFGPAAILACLGCTGEMWVLLAGDDVPQGVTIGSNALVAMVPWVGWVCWNWRRQPPSELERRWLDFRDRFGTMWSLRIREQFNNAAEHAGWPVVLTWNGSAPRTLEIQENKADTDMVAGFRSLIRRFVD
jgi:hypothetical protein